MSFKLPNNLLKLPNNTAKQLMNKVVAKQNGDVSDGMKKFGYNYELNYGVSIPVLKQIAKTTEPSHEVATFLRQHYNIREALILSSMVDEPEKITHADIPNILNILSTVELIQQFAKNIFAHTPTLPNLFDNQFKSNSTWILLCLWSLGWALRLRRCVDNQYINQVIEALHTDDYYKDKKHSTAINFCIQSIAENEQYSQNIMDLAKYLIKTDNPLMKQTGEEFIWLNT